MNIITRLEEAILISIWRLKDNAHRVAINKQVSKSSQKKYSLGALYFALDQLFRKGFVKKTLGRVYHEKGGRSRTYYTLTAEGKKALGDVRAYQQSLWLGITELTFDVKKQ